MRPFIFMRNLSLLIALVSPAFLIAQFQQPTGEELKMTADPKAPGAAAVYLNVEEVANDPQHYFSYYARIKVLQEKGKELATVQLPYISSNVSITEIKARTIHSDGTVIPLVGNPEDILTAKIKNKEGESLQISRKVFTLPSVEVGSILEYRYSLRYPDQAFQAPFWRIQQSYFVHKARYFFTPARGFFPGTPFAPPSSLMDHRGSSINFLQWSAMLPPGTQLKQDKAAQLFIIELEDIPPIPDEDWMPPTDNLFCHVKFYYTHAHNATDYWITEAKLWSKDVDHFADPSKAIKQEVFSVVSVTDPQLEMAKKLYKAVQALDNTDYSRKKSEAELKQLKLKEVHRAEDVWEQKSGNSEEIAKLYLAMVRAAGIKAYDMLVVNRNRGAFDQTILTFNQFDDDIIILNIDGKDIVVDPGEKMCPFQTVDWRHSGATGFRQGTDLRGVATSPLQNFADNKTTRTGDITLNANGAVTGNLNIVITGQRALYWRQLALQNDLDEIKKQFDHELESVVPDGVEAHVDHIDGLSDPEATFNVAVNLRGTLGSSTSRRLIVPGFFFQTRGGQPFVNQAQRKEPVDMHYPVQDIDQIVYHLPSGLTVEGAPRDSAVPWEEHGALVTKSKIEPGQVTIARSFTRSFTIARFYEYDDLRDFYLRVAAADRAQLVLAKTPPVPKGN